MDQAKDEFLAAVAHELRTPLAAARALVEILEDHKDLPEEERARFTALVRKEMERLSRLVEEVLELSRLQALPLKRERVDLKALSEEALALVAPLAGERGVVLSGRLEALSAQTDRDRLLQVLLNLLSNALRHARKEVRLTLRKEGQEALFRVEDDGPGLGAEEVERVFEPFQSKTGGLGLGLSLARRMVEAMGGRIWAEAGPGGRFAFTLPLEVEDAGSLGGR
jgi:signal transduction histidine kinase